MKNEDLFHESLMKEFKALNVDSEEDVKKFFGNLDKMNVVPNEKL
jgi:hypothetical protein